jgi:hypothetical protein
LRIDVKKKERGLLLHISRQMKEMNSIMGYNGSRPISTPTAMNWYEIHPTRWPGKSLPILTIIFWSKTWEGNAGFSKRCFNWYWAEANS